jgi:uncharacterized membrane protein
MSNLVVAVFNDEYRAQQAISELTRVYRPRPDLDNALLLTWRGRIPIALQSQNLADATGARWGRLWGALLRSVISETDPDRIHRAASSVRSTFQGGGVQSKALSEGSSEDYCRFPLEFPSDFVRDIAALITPGRSAIFFLSKAASLHSASGVTHGYGGTMVTARLSARDLSRIKKIVSARTPRDVSGHAGLAAKGRKETLPAAEV